MLWLNVWRDMGSQRQSTFLHSSIKTYFIIARRIDCPASFFYYFRVKRVRKRKICVARRDSRIVIRFQRHPTCCWKGTWGGEPFFPLLDFSYRYFDMFPLERIQPISFSDAVGSAWLEEKVSTLPSKPITNHGKSEVTIFYLKPHILNWRTCLRLRNDEMKDRPKQERHQNSKQKPASCFLQPIGLLASWQICENEATVFWNRKIKNTKPDISLHLPPSLIQLSHNAFSFLTLYSNRATRPMAGRFPLSIVYWIQFDLPSFGLLMGESTSRSWIPLSVSLPPFCNLLRNHVGRGQMMTREERGAICKWETALVLIQNFFPRKGAGR